MTDRYLIESRMTIEQAIRLLDPETTAEAIAEIEYYRGFHGRTAGVQAVSDACDLACEIMSEHQQTKDALAGMEIMLETAQSAAQTFERQLNAALDDLRGSCRACKYSDPGYTSNECFDCIRGSSWEWRGEPKEE